MSRKEAAEYLGTTWKTLAWWKSVGTVKIPYVKIGNRIKYRKADLDKFIEKNRSEPVSEAV